MNHVIFDTETTDLNGEIIQFAAVVTGDKVNTPLQLINFYCMPTAPISAGATAVHGITNEMIYELSGGKTFEDYVLNEYRELFLGSGSIFHAYNIKFDTKMVNNSLEKIYYSNMDGKETPMEKLSPSSKFVQFDSKMVNNTLSDYSMCSVNFGKTIESMRNLNPKLNYNHCLMESFRKLTNQGRRLKLSEALEIIKNDYDLDEVWKQISPKVTDNKFHDALYDSVGAWLILNYLEMYLF